MAERNAKMNELAAAIENIRVLVYRLLQSPKTLEKFLKKADPKKTGLLGIDMFRKLVKKIVKKENAMNGRMYREEVMQGAWNKAKRSSAVVDKDVIEHVVWKQWLCNEVVMVEETV